MYCHHGIALKSPSGGTLPGYFIECLSGETVVPIYADNLGSPIASLSGVTDRAKTDARGNFFFYVTDGTYNLKYYDDNGVYQFTETGFTMDGGGLALREDLADSSGAALIGTGSGGTVQSELNARPTSAVLAATTGASLIGSNDGASGTLWTTIAGFVSRLMSSAGSAIVGTADGGTVQDKFDILQTEIPRGETPTAVASATAGLPNGTYYYRITFVTPLGEGAASAPSSSVAPASKQVDLTVPVSADPTVTARKIYRNVAGAADAVLGKLVATISDNTTTAYVDNVADGSLGASVPDFGAAGVWEVGGAVVASANSISTRFGKDANPNNSGYANTAIGTNALNANTTGFRNTGVGVDAFQFNTTGYEMTAMGVHALGGNTTGRQSCAFGYGTLENANADYNAAFGTKAMSSTTTGTQNSAFGAFSLQLVVGGSNNAGHGYNAGYGIVGGSGNTAVGMDAGKVIGAGNFNTFIGFQSGIAATASGNSAVGMLSLNSLTSGSDNTALGGNAGKSLTTGTGNCFIGTNAGNSGSQKVDAFVSIAIGYGAYNDRDRQVVIGNATWVDETVLFGVVRAGTVYTVATLPSAATMGQGARTFVTDANATTFASIVAGGGANKVPVYSDGTDWRIG